MKNWVQEFLSQTNNQESLGFLWLKYFVWFSLATNCLFGEVELVEDTSQNRPRNIVFVERSNSSLRDVLMSKTSLGLLQSMLVKHELVHVCLLQIDIKEFKVVLMLISCSLTLKVFLKSDHLWISYRVIKLDIFLFLFDGLLISCEIDFKIKFTNQLV